MAVSETGAIAQISRARHLLAQASDLSDIKAVRDMAVAAVEYARAAKLGEAAINEASEIKVRAEYLAGQALAVGPKNPGHRFAGDTPGVSPAEIPTLAEQGITLNQSKTWQDMALIPEPEFEAALVECKEQGKPAATKPLAQKGREHKRQQMTAQMNAPSVPSGTAAAQAGLNPQNIIDAALRRDVLLCLASLAQLATYHPQRVVAVFTLERADEIERSLGRFSAWTDRFKDARARSLKPRALEG